jgi:hypothetical protein
MDYNEWFFVRICLTRQKDRYNIAAAEVSEGAVELAHQN